MKKDMVNKKNYCDTFQEVHAPKALAGKVMNMTNQNENNASFIKKMAVTAASLIALFIGSNAVALAATGNTWVSGFFKDVTRWDSAVIGTEYVTTPEEIVITVSDRIIEDDHVIIPITVQFNDTENAPFNCLEELALGNVFLTDSTGKEIPLQINASEPTYSDIVSGITQLRLTLPTNQLEQGAEYSLHIESLYGYKKADAPLLISGDWNCPVK